MNAQTTGSVYEKTYQEYLKQLNNLNFIGKEKSLGIAVDGPDAVVPYFGTSVRLTAHGLKDATGRRPDFADCVVICRYLIMCPPYESQENQWSAYRDFPDAGPLTVYWADSVENRLARRFEGHVDALRRACDALGGEDTNPDIACDLCRQFTPLPKVPLLLVYNDVDDDFAASVSLLFEKRASTYLDAESQAILGHLLVQRLTAEQRP